MISFCLLNETLGGIYAGVRDGNLGQIGSSTWDSIKTAGRGAVAGARMVASGAKTAADGAVAMGKHIARNKEAYGYGAGIAAGLGALGGYWLAPHDK